MDRYEHFIDHDGNNQHLIVYGYIGRTLFMTEDIKMIIYGFYSFWDSSITDDLMIIQNTLVKKKQFTVDLGNVNGWYNAFSVRFTESRVNWKFKVVECGRSNCWGVLGITQENEACKHLGAWFQKSKNKSILLWTGMSFIFNAGEYILMDKNDWNVQIGDVYGCDVNLEAKTVTFSKNRIVLKTIQNIIIRNGYRVAIAFNANDAIEVISN